MKLVRALIALAVVAPWALVFAAFINALRIPDNGSFPAAPLIVVRILMVAPEVFVLAGLAALATAVSAYVLYLTETRTSSPPSANEPQP